MADAGEGHELRVPLTDLTYIRIDNQTRLQLGDTEVVIESPFELEVGGVTHHLDPSERGGLGPLLALWPDAVASASVDSEATLRLGFVSGATIVVRADPNYEAWQVNGPGNYLVVCVPGTDGRLAVWT